MVDLFGSRRLSTPRSFAGSCADSTQQNLAGLPAGENPVKKIPLVVSGSKGQLFLDELGGGLGTAENGVAENGAGGAQNGAINGRGRRDADQRLQMLALQLQLAATQCTVDNVKNAQRPLVHHRCH